MTFEQIVEHLKSKLGESVIQAIDELSTPKAIIIDKENLLQICGLLHEDERLYFDSLSCLTGLDNGEEAGTMEAIYNLYSIPHNLHLMVKVVLERTKPTLQSVAQIWKTADWQEREAYDMLGIDFIGHSDLRRILMPADWDGHPLRKDYKVQEYYRGIKVDY